MTGFDARRFERVVFERTKSPSEKRRLKKRLEERKRCKDGLPSTTPAPASKLVTSEPHEERKAIRVARSRKRFNRKLRERQRLARRSSLPELVCRSGGSPICARQGCTTNKKVGSRSNTPLSRSDDWPAEEMIELSSDSKLVLPHSENIMPNDDFELDHSSKWRDALDSCPVARRLETELYWERRKAWSGRGYGRPAPSLTESTD